jgi:hypothetical protein
LNNPLAFVDPSGHQSRRRDDPADFGDVSGYTVLDRNITQGEEGYQDCANSHNNDNSGCKNAFAYYGITIGDGDWTAAQLLAMLDGIRALIRKAGWSLADFKQAMGIYNGHTVTFVKKDALYGRQGESANTQEDWSGNHTVTFFGSSFAETDAGPGALTAAISTVHELAHVWDHEYGKTLSGDFQKSMHSGWVDPPCFLLCGGRTYDIGDQGDVASEYARKYGPEEDWAESVAAFVFGPSHGTSSLGSEYTRFGDPATYQSRLAFVQSKFDQYRR